MSYEHERRSSVSDRDFGRLESEVVALKAQNARLENQIERMDAKIDVLVTAITEAKGGWKMLLAVGSASAIVATSITKFIVWFKGG
jgi:phage shock protein A